MDDLSPFAPLMEAKVSPEARLTALQKVECVRRAEIFSEVVVEQLFQLAMVAREARFARGQIIFRAGEPADAFYLIVEGEVELSSADGGLREVVGSGRSFGLYAVLAREPRRVSATAQQATLAIAIEAEDFNSLLSDNTEIFAGVLRYFAQKCLRPYD